MDSIWKFTLSIILSFSTSIADCQPGWVYKLDDNLNDIEYGDIENCLKDPLCKMFPIRIDSSTNLQRISILRNLERVSIDIDLDSIPYGLNLYDFKNLNHLTIIGNNRLTDISNLGYLDSLVSLEIVSFGSSRFKIDSRSFANLKTFLF